MLDHYHPLKTNFIGLQTMFLCHKTEYPDELSFEEKKTYQQLNASIYDFCINGIEFENYDKMYTI